MPTAQFNLKIDPRLKKRSETIAKKLGFSLSSVVRAFLIDFSETKKVSFFVKDKASASVDLAGKDLEKRLVKAGLAKKYAREHGRAYDQMLAAEKTGKLTRW